MFVDDVLRRDHLASLVRGRQKIQPWSGKVPPDKNWTAPHVRTEDEIWQAPIATPQHCFRWKRGHDWENDNHIPTCDTILSQIFHSNLALDMGAQNTGIDGRFYDDFSLDLILAAIQSLQTGLTFTWRFDTRLLSAREYATALTQMVQPVLLTTTLVNGLHEFDKIHPHTALRHDLFHASRRSREMKKHTQDSQEFINLLTGLGWVALAMDDTIEELNLDPEEDDLELFRNAQEAVLDGQSTTDGQNLLDQIFLRVFNLLTDNGDILRSRVEDKLEKAALCRKFLTALDRHINLVMAEHPSRDLFQETIRQQIHSRLGLDIN